MLDVMLTICPSLPPPSADALHALEEQRPLPVLYHRAIQHMQQYITPKDIYSTVMWFFKSYLA